MNIARSAVIGKYV